MEYKVPTVEQVRISFRAMKTLLQFKGHTPVVEAEILGSLQRMLGINDDIQSLATIEPEELAQGIIDAQTRHHLLNLLIILSLLDGEAKRPEVELIKRYANAFGVREPWVKNFYQSSEYYFNALWFDLLRRFWFIKRDWSPAPLIKHFQKMVEDCANMLDSNKNQEFITWYRKLEHYPVGSLGKEYFDYVEKKDLIKPGTMGLQIKNFMIHDCYHLLAEYGTDSYGELLLSAFSAGIIRREPHAFFFFFVIIYGLLLYFVTPMIPGEKTALGDFNPQEVLKALQRGTMVNINLFDDWEPWQVMDQQISELQNRYNIPPLNRSLEAVCE